jgi:plasmid maintenance system antidote protein VapI
MKIGEEIESELKKKGISQATICKRADIYPSLLSNIIAGERRLDIKTAIKLELFFIKTANYWLIKQLEEDIKAAKVEDGRF